MNAYDTLGDFYADSSATHEAVMELADAGVLSQAQMGEMFDGETLSSQGREILENMLIGKAFESKPDIVRMITEVRSMRQSVITALSEISNNKLLGEDYSLENELISAMELVYKARQSGIKVGDRASIFARQGNLFQLDEGATVADYTNATVMMLSDIINDSRVTQLKKMLAVYNKEAKDSAAGQLDMFSGSVESKQDILKRINELFNYGTEEEQQSAIGQSVEQRKAESIQQNGTVGEDSGERRPGRREDNLAKTEYGYKLSDEIDDNGRQFVLTNGGNLSFGEIAEDTGMMPAPIMLSEGMITNHETNDGYGLVHIEARHGKQIRAAGYKSVIDFIEEVAKNYEVIKEGKDRNGNKTYLLQLTDKHNNTLIVELSNDNSYWNINTAGIFKKSYGSNNKEMYNRHTTVKPSAETVETSQDAERDGNQASSSMNVPTSSVGKDKSNVSEKQVKGLENYSRKEITDVLKLDIENKLKEADVDAEIVGIEINGSRGRNTAHEGSDLDVVVEYTGTEREDDMFNILNESPLYFEGIRVDVNPITEGKSGTLKSFMERSNKYDIQLAEEREKVDTAPTEAQKKAGNYKKGHVRIDGYDVTIENPKGSERSGKDAGGKPWSITMNNDYGYIKGTEGVDGDHIDVFLSATPNHGNVFVVDQINTDGSFDEHKVMYGFSNVEEAKAAYLSNYSKGWKGLGNITEISKEEFKKWIDSSTRKTKPFADYKNLKKPASHKEIDNEQLAEERKQNILKNGTTFDTPFALKHPVEIKTVEDIDNNAEKIISGLARNEGNGKLDNYEGFAYGGKYANNASEQINEYLHNLIGVLPKELLDEWAATHSFKTYGDIAKWAEGEYKKDRNLEKPSSPDNAAPKSDETQRQEVTPLDDLSNITEAQQAATDAVMQTLKDTGVDVTVLDDGAESPSEARRQAVGKRAGALKKAADTIKGWIEGNKRNKYFTIELPQATQAMIKKVMGRDFDSHNITANGIAHALKNHGGNGDKLNDKSIAIRKEDTELIPYIMTAPDYVTKGSDDMGRKSVRFYKTLSNGYVVVVEKEQKNSPDDMDTITMWAEKSTDVTDARNNTSPMYHAQDVIISTDAAKIIKDAETATEKDVKVQNQKVFHGSGNDFDHFDFSHMGEGEGAQAYGWGGYATEVEGIGRGYAIKARRYEEKRFLYKGKPINSLEKRLAFDAANAASSIDEAIANIERQAEAEIRGYDKTLALCNKALDILNQSEESDFMSKNGEVHWKTLVSSSNVHNYPIDPIIRAYYFLIYSENKNIEDAKKEARSVIYCTKVTRTSKLEESKGVIDILRHSKKSDFTVDTSRHLYGLSIPDNDGNNYISWDKPVTEEQKNTILELLLDKNANDGITSDKKYHPNISEKELGERTDAGKKRYTDYYNSQNFTGKSLYKYISKELGSDKAASEFLNRAGFVGIEYPAQYTSGGRTDNAKNYVIFNEKDMKITDHIKFFRYKDGTPYGCTVGGKIYIWRKGLNPNTPIHEFTHLWADVMRKGNPKEWGNIRKMLKGTPVWDEVLNDKNYQEIHDNEDDVASEVLSRISGRKNSQRIVDGMQKGIDEAKAKGDIFGMAEKISTLQKIKDALHKFWNWVGKDLLHIHFKSVDEVADRVLYDMVEGKDVNRNLKNPVKPEETENERIAGEAKKNGTYMKAPNGKTTKLNEKQWVQVRTKNFKDWFGDWEKDPEHASKVVDENGEPMVVYHGTQRGGFNTFAGHNPYGGDLKFWYFSKDKDTAKIYMIKWGSNPTMYDVFLNIKNPYIANDTETIDWKLYDDKSFRQELLDKGYDGMMNDDKSQLVALDSNQVKSSTGNNGDFSTANNDIRYQFAGDKGWWMPNKDEDKSYMFFNDIDNADGYIRTRETRVDEFYDKGQPERNQTKVYIPSYLVLYTPEDNSDPTVREYERVDEALRNMDYDYDSDDKNPFSELRVGFKEAWIGEDGETVEESDEATDIEKLHDKIDLPSYIDELGIIKTEALDGKYENYTKSEEEIKSALKKELSGTTYELDREKVRLDINRMVLGKYNSVNVVNEKGENKGLITIRISDHSYNPSNNGEGQLQGNFISIVIGKDPTENKFNGKYNIHYSGDVSQLLEEVEERVDEIIYDWDNDDERVRYRMSEEFKDGEKIPITTHIDWWEKDHGNGNGETYTVDGINDTFDSKDRLLDAFRNKYEGYVATLSEDGKSIVTEPWSKYLKGGKSAGGVSTEEHVAKKTRNAQTAVADMAKKLNLDNVEVITDAAGLKGKKRNAKGWFDTATGKITIVLPNHTSTSDVIRTLLHEGVAHYGLRKMFGKHFDDFLDNVYNNAEKPIRDKIDASAAKNKWDKRKATDEYLGSLAEDTDFNNITSGWFAKVKNFFMKMIAKVGIKLDRPITDNDLKYTLWRSYQNLKHPGERTIFEEAEDIAMQSKLKVGGYEDRNLVKPEEAAQVAEPQPIGRGAFGDIYDQFRGKVKEAFDFLIKHKSGDLLGVFHRDGIGDIDLVWGDKNENKGLDHIIDKHVGKDKDFANVGDAMSAIKDVINNGVPIKEKWDKAIFEKDGKRVVVSKNVRDDKGNIVEDKKNWVVTSYDNIKSKKEKQQSTSTRVTPESDKGGRAVTSDAVSAGKDSKVSDTKQADEDIFSMAERIAKEQEAKNNEDEDGLLFREGEAKDRASARDVYEKKVSGNMWQFQEAMQDSMLGLKTLMDTIAKANGHKVSDFENAYMAENLMSSANQAQAKEYAYFKMKPLLDVIDDMKEQGANDREIRDYLMTKHGLERNVVFSTRDAQSAFDKYQKEHPEGQQTFNEFLDEYRQRDYSGLTALTSQDNVAAAEANARQMVEDFEQKTGMDNIDRLWEHVNDCTKTTLQKIFESGIIDKDTYEKTRDMFKYYVPLRGWDDKTSDEVYGYFTSNGGPMRGSIMKKAEGRKSKADDPLATISAMAEKGISEGNRNLMKQRFLNFVQNNPSDAVSVNSVWMEYDKAHDEWKPMFAKLKADDTADVVEKKVADFEAEMEELAQQEPERYKKGSDAVDIPYIVKKEDMREHQVLVKRGGKTYVLTINGNPRAAQALNGLTNPDTQASSAVDHVMKAGEYINRQLSAVYTTRNPGFVASNFIRDAMYANSMVWVKESPVYALRFHRNFLKYNPTVIGHLLWKYEHGTLDTNDDTDKAFYQFMHNGGETGYTIQKSIEDHKKEIKKELKKHTSMTAKGYYVLGERLNDVNRSVENCARFAAFITSRQMERSIDRSVYDAKEISVNFNKKGSGAKTMGMTGETLFGSTAALTSGLGRGCFVFWNAAVQGTFNIGKNIAKHPVKGLTFMASNFLLAMLIASIGSGGDGDDDEGGNYYDLPEYVRRSNICFKMFGKWITVPLSVEQRAIYGMGELAYSVMSGNEKLTNGEIAVKISEQLSQCLPIDMLEGEGGVMAAVPSFIKPVVEDYVNKDWTGLPIYKKDVYPNDEYIPKWKRTYKSANKMLVNASKKLNELSEGNDYVGEGIGKVNPAVVEHLLTGYFGGVASTIKQFADLGYDAAGKRDFDWRDVPVASRLIKSADERTQMKAVNEKFFHYKEEYDNLKSATKPLNVLIAFTRPLITEFADNLNLKHPLLPTISPYPTM